MRYNDSFAVRSSDLKWRVRLSLYKNDDAEQPYKVAFHSVMTMKRSMAGTKHHAAGYLGSSRTTMRTARRRATSSRCAIGVEGRRVGTRSWDDGLAEGVDAPLGRV